MYAPRHRRFATGLVHAVVTPAYQKSIRLHTNLLTCARAAETTHTVHRSQSSKSGTTKSIYGRENRYTASLHSKLTAV